MGEPESARLVTACTGTVMALRIPRSQPRCSAVLGLIQRMQRWSHASGAKVEPCHKPFYRITCRLTYGVLPRIEVG